MQQPSHCFHSDSDALIADGAESIDKIESDTPFQPNMTQRRRQQ